MEGYYLGKGWRKQGHSKAHWLNQDGHTMCGRTFVGNTIPAPKKPHCIKCERALQAQRERIRREE